MRRAVQATRNGSAALQRHALSYPRTQYSRHYASVTALDGLPKVGEHHHGFTLKRTKHVPELELSALEFTHVKTGAQYLHIARDDQNNVFSIGFKSNPPDATGVPHILEHTTLCGSEKYPVRDPFFKMLPRSLSNFMNAYTSADHTTYPFATTNAQDYDNLMGVYLDATLKPLLKEHDFSQEGWRLAPEDALATNRDGLKLGFKGVVYNEMKGQMSDARYLYYIRFLETLFPSINNSGGDPQKMTDLTYQQLRNFHAEHYHPSNAKIITYGNLSVLQHLRKLSEQLEPFHARTVDRDIKTPRDLSSGSGHEERIKGPVDVLLPPHQQLKTSLAWVTGETSNTVETFALSLISSLLLDGYGSPLYRNLIESGLGTDYSPITGFDSSSKRGIFAIGLNGVHDGRLDEVHESITKTLKEVQTSGFEQQKVDGILHQLEIGLKHKTANFGMSMIDRLNPAWFNGIDVFDALAWQSTLDAFKAEYAKGGFLEGLVEKYLLSGNHLRFTMEPSMTYTEDLAADEASRLSTKISEAYTVHGGEDKAKAFLHQRELELVAQQDASQDLACLPTVHVKDIPRIKESHKPRKEIRGNVRTQWVEAPTNGLTYFRSLSIVESFPIHLRPLVPLFCDSLMRLGTKSKDVGEIEDLIKLKTGGLSVGYHLASSPLDPQNCEEGFTISGLAFDRNVADMYELLRMIITETNFDGPKAQMMMTELIRSAASGAVDSVLESGNAYASRLASAAFTPRGARVEQTSGITQIVNIGSLASSPGLETTLTSQLLQAFKQIQSVLVNNLSGMRVALTCGQDAVSSNASSLDRFLKTFSSAQPNLTKIQDLTFRDWRESDKPNVRDLLPATNQVSYSALSTRTVPYVDLDSPALTILAELLTHNHLHREIREKGGAYGAGARSNPIDGTFGMSSYRDPNAPNTLKIMGGAGRWAVDRRWTDLEMQEAKISVFKSVDAPRAVNEEGMTEFATGITPEMEQQRRERFLDVTPEQVREVAEKYLLNVEKTGRLAVIAQKDSGADGGSVSDIESLAVSGWLSGAT